MNQDDAWKVATCIAWYVANREENDFIKWLFAGREPHPAYVKEWRQRWSHGFPIVWGSMDFQNQRRFIQEILKTYEVIADSRFEGARRYFEEQAAREGL